MSTDHASDRASEVTVLQPMSAAQHHAWRTDAIADYAAGKIAARQWRPADAQQLAQKEFEALLPHGIDTPDHFLMTMVDAQQRAVGVLWFAIVQRLDQRVAYVYDVTVAQPYRRQGHAARAFLALQDDAKQRGLAGIALHVFGQNTGARAMYDKLGFAPTNLNLFKPL